jgi:hypothetical protein
MKNICKYLNFTSGVTVVPNDKDPLDIEAEIEGPGSYKFINIKIF